MSGFIPNQESLQLAGPDARSLMEAGMAHCQARSFPEARSAFAQLQQIAPTQPLAEIGFGSVCFAEGEFAAAIEHYRAALRLNPRSAYAYALLGEAQIFAGDYAAAPFTLGRAIELDRHGPHGRLAHGLLRFLESLPKPVPAHHEDKPL